MKPILCVLTFILCLLVPIRAGFAQSGIITTYVGPVLPSDGTAANTQVVDSAMSVIGDGAGGFYFTSDGQNRVYKVTASGVISTVAGSGARGFSGDGGSALTAMLNSPHGIALDTAGNLYVADYANNRVRKITTGGIITTIAGNGTPGGSGDGGPAISAQLNQPRGIAVDSAGNVYIADVFNNRVRKVTTAGLITTVAGNGISSFSGDGGPATAAAISVPMDVVVDASGNLFIADGGNHRVRKVTAGVISTFAGSTFGFAGDGGPATAAQLNSPYNIDVDAVGSLFIADRGNNRIRKVTGGVIDTIAGLGTLGFGGDGGPATSALFNQPEGIAVDAAGNIFVADTGNNRVRQFTVGGLIATVAGRSTAGYSGDGGLAVSASINGPQAVAVDAAGNAYIADTGNSRVRKVTSGGVITTVAGDGTFGFNGDGIAATSAKVGVPAGLAVDSGGNLYISDSNISRVRKVDTNGMITTVAGNGTFGFYGNGDGGPATSAALGFVTGLAVDTQGNLFIADRDNNCIRKVTPQGVISTVAGNGANGYSGDGGPAVSAAIDDPIGIAVDANGNLFIADSFNARIRKVSSNGIISTIAGDGTFSSGVDGGPAVAVGLSSPKGLSVDALGNVYFADIGLVRKITPDGLISTIVGDRNPGFRGDGGVSIAAEINRAQSVAVDASGNLFIADTGNNRIRKVARRTPHDFNNDGKADILWRNNAGDVSAWILNGYTVTSNSSIANLLGGWSIAGTGDFDGDGKTDILWRNTSGDVAIWRMDGATVSNSATVGNLPSSWAIAGVADFNADGRSDILWRNTSGDVAAWLMNGFTVTNTNTLIANKPSSWTIAGTGDFDGDGKGDVLWRDVSGGVEIWMMNGTSVNSNTTIANIWPGWAIVGVADFNANGRADILWRDETGNVAMWLMNGTTVASWSLIANIWKGWSIVGTGDFNGNGKTDVLWRDESGTVAIWMMDGDRISSFGSMGNVSDRLPQ